ncbi:hypothetical protein [Peribacillus simplex]|uniref:Uncharacterized protein n=1 Tax=Peribacillus simplex TaxID=1478 RepID=A0A9W4KUU8_9BACI|nr:hypothetical protein [Peribacillus simplex]CAH0184920.1 hypothetical protein SRABI133_01520 [Peribacillus simplex]
MDTELKLLTNKILKKESSKQIIYDFKKYLNQNSQHIIFNWHPLGFVHSKLCNIHNIGDLRLHVWLDGFRNTQQPHMPIHDHIFNVNSFILSGTVTNHIYEVGKDNGHLYRVYEAQYNNGGSLLSSTEELLTCRLKSSDKHSKGDFYIVKKEIFHESTVDVGDFAATLVIATERDDTKRPRILGPIKSHEYFYSREKCNEPILEIINERL